MTPWLWFGIAVLASLCSVLFALAVGRAIKIADEAAEWEES